MLGSASEEPRRGSDTRAPGGLRGNLMTQELPEHLPPAPQLRKREPGLGGHGDVYVPFPKRGVGMVVGGRDAPVLEEVLRAAG